MEKKTSVFLQYLQSHGNFLSWSLYTKDPSYKATGLDLNF